MPSSAPQKTVRSTSPARARTTTVCIVDPQGDEYQAWRAAAESAGVRVATVATAAEALKIARTQSVDLWLISSALAGLSGVELCTMLRTRSRQAPVVMVAEQYSPELERAAWAARATLFVCKPAHQQWLGDWLESYSTPDKSRR